MCNTRTPEMGRVRRSCCGVAVASAVAVAALTQGVLAQGYEYPYHTSGGALCYGESGGGAIRVYPPPEMYSISGSYEKVEWSADVYIYRRGNWRPYITSMPWLSRVTDRDGTLNAYDGSSWMQFTSGAHGRSITWWRFYGLRRGRYRVREYFRWQGRYVSSEWARFSRNDPPSFSCVFS